MDVRDTRLANLELLAKGYKYDKDFCDAVGIRASYLSQLRSGAKNLGNELARQIEERRGLEPGWMDVAHTTRHDTGQGNLPPEMMTVAYAMASLPAGTRENLMRLILGLAQEQVGREVQQFNPAIPTFTHQYGQLDSDGNLTPAEAGAAAGRRSGTAG